MIETPRDASVTPASRSIEVPPSDSFAALADFGWDEGFAACFREAVGGRPVDAVPGRVLRRDRNACQVAIPGDIAHIPIGAHLLDDGIAAPTTGDYVVVANGEITAVLERRTSIMRAGYRDLAAQVLAANVDTVLVVSSLQGAFRPRRLERLLVIAWQTGAVPIVVLTKADCCPDLGSAYDEAVAVAPGVAVHVVSSVTGEGMPGLAAELRPRTTSVMIGPSGVGKSTLANYLNDGAGELETQEVRSDGKGRHTTVTRELIVLAGGALMIDTPGLRAIGLWDATEALGDAFSDVEELAGACRFNDCAHKAEPGCAVKAAIATGQLTTERLESYLRLQAEQRRLAARTDARLRAERTAAFRAFTKEQRRRSYR